MKQYGITVINHITNIKRIITIMDKDNEKLEVGPVAENLLQSLRAFERAKDYYFQALEELEGEEWANEQYGREIDIFTPVEELIKRRIGVAISDWAVKRTPTNTI